MDAGAGRHAASNDLLGHIFALNAAEVTPVTVAVRSAVVASVHPSIRATTLDELIALVRSQPGRHSYASPGIGTPPHLVAEPDPTSTY